MFIQSFWEALWKNPVCLFKPNGRICQLHNGNEGVGFGDLQIQWYCCWLLLERGKNPRCNHPWCFFQDVLGPVFSGGVFGKHALGTRIHKYGRRTKWRWHDLIRCDAYCQPLVSLNKTLNHLLCWGGTVKVLVLVGVGWLSILLGGFNPFETY